MIGTHTPKMFNARIKTEAVASRIVGAVPSHIVCSQTASMRREIWAPPANAADMRKWRDIVDNLPAGFAPESAGP